MLDQATFINIVKNTPLVSIDLIIENPDGEILLGKRTNQPAKGFWFVPGGRIKKNEKISEAFSRISKTELGTALLFTKANFLGVFQHFYDQNFKGDPTFGTHYVVLAYQIKIDYPVDFKVENQHEAFSWMKPSELVDNKEVHQYTIDYFIR